MPSFARGNILFDAETSALFRIYADPLIRASGLSPENITIYLQATDQINALASPGRIVLFSGLVLETETPEELQAIIAHEIGHIAAGHIPRLTTQRSRAGIVFLTSQILGFGAIIAGLGPLGVLVLAGGSSISAYSTLSETRIAEASADQAALSYLDQAGISGHGLISFFKREFLPQERAFASANRTEPNPYFRTHPLSSDRLRYLDERVRQAKNYKSKSGARYQMMHDMVRAKLYGFSKTAAATLERYPLSDRSLPARYARAVMFSYHQSDVNKALALIDGLIAEQPRNPYFYELKGYVLTRGARLDEAVQAYESAIRLTPDNAIMRLEIGVILVNAQDSALIKKGLLNLKIAANDPSFAAYVYRPMSRGFSALGDIGLAELATAQALIHENKPQDALRHAKRALKTIAASDRVNRLRAQDIIITVEKTAKPRKRKKK